MTEDKKEKLLMIGDVARSFGVSENRIRRMETDGLLKPAYVSENSGYRYYSSQDVVQIGTILSLRSFGFTTQEISLFLQDPDNLTVLCRILQEKQQLLESYLYQLDRRIKSDEPCECRLISCQGGLYYTKRFEMVPKLDAFAEIECEVQFEAVRKHLFIDCTRPPVIETASGDYRTYNYREKQQILFHIPLRGHAEGQDTTFIPGGNAVEVKWNYPGKDFDQLKPTIDQFFDSLSLKQAGLLRAAYNMGGKTIKTADISSTVMHIQIPVV